VAEGSDDAREFSDAQVVGRGFQTVAPAHQFVVPKGEF
jgi:hypothetical protein